MSASGRPSTASAASVPASTSPDAALTVYYDGACPLCRREIDFYRERDRDSAVDWVDVSASTSTWVGQDLTREDALSRFHVRRPDGTLASGAAGFGELWSVIPGFRRGGRIACSRAVRPVLEIGYRAFLKLRPLLQRLVARADRRPST